MAKSRNTNRQLERSMGLLIWRSLKNTQGIILGAVAILSLFLPLFVDVKAKVSLGLFVSIILISLMVALALFESARKAYEAASHPLPRVLQSGPCQPGYKRCLAMLIVEPSQQLSQNTIVGLYYDRGGFEVRVGYGEAITRQIDQKIQVIVTRIVPGYEDVLEKLKNNNQDTKEKLLVKPTVGWDFFENMVPREDWND